MTPINTTTILASAAYVNSLYMVGGNTGFLATSTDAVSWTTQSVGSTGTINSIAFGNSLYVLSDGLTGRSIYTSTDAVTWDVNFNLGSLLGLYSVTYGGSKFVGGGQNGVVVTSTDGSQWTTNKVRPPTITSAGGSPALIYGDKFVATNALSNNAWVGVSTDAKNWDINYVGTTSSIHAVIYESIYVAAGRSGALFTSTDAVTWDSRTSGTSSHIYSLGYGGGLYLYAGSGGALATSTDGITWDARTSGTSSTIFSIGYDGSSLYFYGAGGGGLRTSTDGITWDSRTSGTSSSIYAMGYGNSLYFYGGAGGVLRTSTDGITWDARTSNTASSIYSMLYANSLYLYSTNGGVGTSTDGITWNLWNIDDRSLDFQGLTENGGNLYVNSRKGAYTSTDGQDWTALTEISQTITSVAYNSSLYVAAGELGIIYSSTDGLSWTKRESHTTTSINSLVYGTTLVAVGNSGYLSTSTDGITWDLGDSGVEYNLSGLGYGNSTYLAASISSFQSYIITASNTYSYNSVTDFQLPTDNDLNITTETVSNFPRKLYIKYQ